MKKNLFGNNIKVDCEYCNNFDRDGSYCVKKKEIKNNKCRKFIYNPLMRVPKAEPALMQFSKEDFIL